MYLKMLFTSYSSRCIIMVNLFPKIRVSFCLIGVVGIHTKSFIKDFNQQFVSQDSIKYLYQVWSNNGVFTYTTSKYVNSQLGEIGTMDKYDYTEAGLLSISEYLNNVKALQRIFDSFSIYNSYAIAFVVRNGGEGTLSTLDRHYLVNNTTNAAMIIENVYHRIDALSGRYNFYPDDKITIKIRALHFKVKDPVFKGGRVRNTAFFPSDVEIKNLSYKILSPKMLPHTMELEFYGFHIHSNNNIMTYQYNNVILIVEVVEKNRHHRVQILSIDKFKLIAKVEDISYGNTIVREILNDNKQNLVVQYNDNFKLINLEYEIPVKFMEIIESDGSKPDKILSFDIETYQDDSNKSIAYACGFTDGKITRTYYLTDFNSPDEMLLECLSDMFIPKYHNYTVYCHNFGGFDAIFLYKLFYKNFKVTRPPLSKDMSIISMIVKSKETFGKIRPCLKFQDSKYIIPGKLRDIAISFGVELKGYFPYDFVNKDNLTYVGLLPDIKYYDLKKDEIDIYMELALDLFKNKNSVWDMRKETIEYLEKDLKALYKIMDTMGDILFKAYRVDITKHNTISSITMNIFRTRYLQPEHKIANTTGKVEQAIREAFFGGRAEVFIPKGLNLHYYDVNGLYPYAMMQPMPVGTPVYSLCKDLSKIFGFVKANITTPGINKPVLPCRVMVNGEYKLIFPIGNWCGWYFSEELKLAEKHGYTIDIVESYIFEKGYDYFKSFISEMARMKEISTGAKRHLYKLIMNSFFGRMGMNEFSDEIKILSNLEAEKIHLTNNVIDNFQIDEDKQYIRYHKLPDQILCEQSGVNYEELLISKTDSNSPTVRSSAISAATASWARIIMYPHILKALYTDTDSTVLKEPMDEKFVDEKKIGLFKPEYKHVFSGIFPAVKLYALNVITWKNKIELIAKHRGYKGDLTFDDYINLFNGRILELKDKRWKRNLGLGEVYILERPVELTAKFDKRKKIYSLGEWVDTTPLCINPNFEIISTDLTLYKRKITSLILYEDV